MSFNQPKVNKIGGGLGRRNPSTDKIFGLVAAGPAASGMSVGAIKEFIQLSDAEAVGITASYDSTNGVLLHHHISEYFRLDPDGKLYLMLVAQGTSLTQMCDNANQYVKKLVMDPSTKREIKYVGCVLNPNMGSYTPTLTNGLDGDVLSAIPKATELMTALKAEFIYLDGILIEGRELNGTYAALKDLRTMVDENVSVVIGGDPAIRALDSDYADYAAVGTVLGSLSVRKVNENLGSVDIINKPDARKGSPNYSLTDSAKGLYLKADLSSGVLVSSLTTAEKNTLTAKGFIYMGSFEGYDGVYLNNSPTAVELADDYAFIENNRVWNKACRYIRTALIPKIRGVIKKTPTGEIRATTIADWQQAGQKQLDRMLTDDEVSGISLFIDPAQKVAVGSPLKIKLSIQADDILQEAEVDLGLTSSI